MNCLCPVCRCFAVASVVTAAWEETCLSEVMFLCWLTDYMQQLSFHWITFRVELDMGTTTLLECFAGSRRQRWPPRPLRLMRSFQPIRCYPETSPPQWQCMYSIEMDCVFFFFLHCWDLQINICFHQRQRLLFLFRPDPVTSCLTRCLVSPQSPASTVTLNQSELRGIRPWVTTAPRWWAANWSPALLWTVKKMKMRAGDTAVISVFTVKMQCPAMRMISQSN